MIHLRYDDEKNEKANRRDHLSGEVKSFPGHRLYAEEKLDCC